MKQWLNDECISVLVYMVNLDLSGGTSYILTSLSSNFIRSAWHIFKRDGFRITRNWVTKLYDSFKAGDLERLGLCVNVIAGGGPLFFFFFLNRQLIYRHILVHVRWRSRYYASNEREKEEFGRIDRNHLRPGLRRTRLCMASFACPCTTECRESESSPYPRVGRGLAPTSDCTANCTQQE